MYIIYGKPNCVFCEMAKTLLGMKAIDYDYVDLSEDRAALSLIKSEGHKTVPVIKLNGRLIGGYAELKETLDNK